MSAARLQYYLARAQELPLREVLVRGGALGWRIVADRARKLRDQAFSTYLRLPITGELRRRIVVTGSELSSGYEGLAAACNLYVQHRFDLLGSGWVSVRHGSEC